MKHVGVIRRVLLTIVAILLATSFAVALGDAEEDVAKYTQAIEENPVDAAAYNNRGDAYYKLEHY